MSRVRVAAVDALEEGEGHTVSVDGTEVAVFRFDGSFYAVSNTCLHDGGPICRGSVHGALAREITPAGERDREYFSDRPAVACPWHGWEYFLDTGEHVGDDDLALPTYDVSVEDGVVFVEA